MEMLMLIDGERVAAFDKALRASFNPATGAKLGDYPLATREDVDRALVAAQKAKRIWAATPLVERKACLLRAADLFEEHAAELAALVTAEMGKPAMMARGEVQEVSDLLRLACSAADMHEGQVFPDPAAKDGGLGDLAFTVSEPLGVVACIGPFNFPVATLTFKTAPALVMGNAVIIKAPSEAPLTVLRYAEILAEAGFPAGVVQSLSGSGARLGEWLVGTDLIDAVTFTGSTDVGSQLISYSAPYFHRTLLELGGNDPLVITEGADLERAVGESMCRMANAGQICCITKRFIVHNSLKERYLELLAQRVGALKVGDPADADNDMGCLASERAAEEVERQIALTIEQGARLVCGGTREGAFVAPTVLDCPSEADAARDLEIFGPVWTVIGFDDDEEALAIANQSVFGLNGGVVADTLEHGMSLAARIQSGTVVCNGEGSFRRPTHCFGGYKHSGLGREGMADLIGEYSQRKTLVIRRAN